ncbi:MAG: hypothetical protein KGJ02_06415 [Verrucomicrobiota bacterium]|nr:hypothetical protein [Verrucomicrobiota bacterium]
MNTTSQVTSSSCGPLSDSMALTSPVETVTQKVAGFARDWTFYFPRSSQRIFVDVRHIIVAKEDLNDDYKIIVQLSNGNELSISYEASEEIQGDFAELQELRKKCACAEQKSAERTKFEQDAADALASLPPNPPPSFWDKLPTF